MSVITDSPIRSSARRFTGIAGRAGLTDSACAIPAQNWREVAESGYIRLFHPEESGGTGADAELMVGRMEELAQACPSTYWSATVSGLLCARLVSTYGSTSGEGAAHKELLSSLVSGQKLAAFAVAETTAGSDASTQRTTVRRAPTGDGYVISGEKSRIANAPAADVAVVLARLGDRADERWCLVFVDLTRPGVHRYDLPHLGLRGMPWGGLVFTDTPVREEDVLEVPLAELSNGMTWGWLLTSVSAIGIAEAALAASVRHAAQRVSFGLPLAHMEGVQAQIAQSRAEIDAAKLLARRAAAERLAGSAARGLIAMLKVYATELGVRVAQRAVQIHGAFGVTTGHEVERLYRDAQMNVIGAFASNRLREVIAEEIGLGTAVHEPFDWVRPAGLAIDPAGLDGPAGSI